MAVPKSSRLLKGGRGKDGEAMFLPKNLVSLKRLSETGRRERRPEIIGQYGAGNRGTERLTGQGMCARVGYSLERARNSMSSCSFGISIEDK